MRNTLLTLALAAMTSLLPGLAQADRDDDDDRRAPSVQLGPRPFFLVGDMAESPLKKRLLACSNRDSFKRSKWSIGHRGAPLQFPEHTQQSYEAAARMGAGIVECDVTFTKDKELVCRHSQNDLHTTTNILETPLAQTCIKPFTPA
ncbi:MAG: glycerophosphodiester phosphodiesterase, partial [Rhizobiales bacterium]|nr:glycerophosphodiester phosphodiesterase [Rhizobacter sp.]